MEECDWCEYELPAGCHHMRDRDKECPLTRRMDKPWIVGMAVWENLMDRSGVKHELGACQIDIQAEIVEAIGKVAIRAME